MRLDRVERERPLGPTTETPTGDGRRWSPPARRGGSWLLKIIVLVALGAAAVWAYRANVTTSRPAMDMTMRVNSVDTPLPVTLSPVVRGAMTGTVIYTGSVAPINEQDIFPRVTGRIVDMPVYPGDAVRAGQVVARLDDIELASRVREAEATAATARASGAQMEADVAAARHGVVQMERELAMIDAELGYARGVRARSERLVASGAISRQEYENDRSMAQALEAKREAAQAKLEQARAMEISARKKLEAAEAMITQGRAASETAQIVRDYVSIVAPTSGYVVKRLVALGVLVQPGMPILKLAQLDRVRLQANVGEKDIAAIRVGSAVTVTTTGGQTLTARVTSVFPFVDQGPRTAVVEAIVGNRDRRLLPGQYVTMQIVTGERADTITVARGAVARLGGAAKVWVVTDGRAEPRGVTTGLESPERVEITHGLTGGERVVARGHEGLFAGARVLETTAGGTPPTSPSTSNERRPVPKEDGHAGH